MPPKHSKMYTHKSESEVQNIAGTILTLPSSLLQPIEPHHQGV